MTESKIGRLTSSPVITRYSGNPILTANSVPYPSTLVFNAGVTKFNDQYIMVFRNDFGSAADLRLDGTNLGLAYSDDGKSWEVQPCPCFELADDDIRWINDPRLTVIDGRCYITFAIIGRHGIRGGIAVTDDFERFDLIHATLPDNRNLALFPQKINGKYMRLERPFANYLRERPDQYEIWLSDSPDLIYWGNSRLLLKTTDVPFCNDKIGPGAPPILTDSGWLVVFHAVDVDSSRGKNGWEARWDKRYTAGVMLLDPDDPSKIINISTAPLLVPEAEYEIAGGFRNNVIFPCGTILEDNGEVKIYYGAADSVECLATANVDDLVALCNGSSNA